MADGTAVCSPMSSASDSKPQIMIVLKTFIVIIRALRTWVERGATRLSIVANSLKYIMGSCLSIGYPRRNQHRIPIHSKRPIPGLPQSVPGGQHWNRLSPLVSVPVVSVVHSEESFTAPGHAPDTSLVLSTTVIPWIGIPLPFASSTWYVTKSPNVVLV